ncbi:cytochrome b/b6 domain-containing protein [Roseovarius sp. M141]|uniref:cytochrome b/b6 domain-containing protein n=1 Tax=Roseovarius sp. M141 TaxID=2583806 RepID=UPI0020CC26D2|nr:cytochrome b/b6 domain-containing protein [Roseovarius sp. M141]MCQ0092234.1 cytochrome [Roseovarius sp. M141]
MQAANTPTSYGWITKTFHWAIALMILSMFALGWIASTLAGWIEAPDIAVTEDTVAWTKLLFSSHKTMGVAIFFLAILRILWAISQPKPGLLNGDNGPEATLAETVHWLLYGSLIAVPLSGWVYHAATTGYAPIWWPLGQTLPFVPKDAQLAQISGALHFILQWVLAGAITLHVLGALKHHIIDRDATLRRMLPGRTEAMPTAEQPGHALPIIAALAIWAAALGAGAWVGWLAPESTVRGEALAEVQSDWTVQDGALNITIVQGGADVTGSFADWTASIAYSEVPDAQGLHGAVTVTVAIASLTLGSVTGQAMGPDYFAVGEWPTATFTADLVQAEDGLIADGTLRIRDQGQPAQMPVTLSIEGDTANATGSLTIDRRDYSVGMGTKDEGTLAFAVVIDWQLTATRAAPE